MYTASYSDQTPETFFPEPEFDVQHAVEKVLQQEKWGLLFLVDARELGVAGLCWLYLNQERTKGCWKGCLGLEEYASFRVETHFESVTEALTDPDSDIRFAVPWMQLPLEVQRHLNTIYTRGDEEELRAVVSAIATYEDEAQQFRRLVYENNFCNGNWLHEPDGILRFTVYPDPPPCPRLEIWLKIILAYFGTGPDTHLMKKHECVEYLPPWFVVEISPPSHHERLEAALFLQGWAKDKIPPDELRLLLPTL